MFRKSYERIYTQPLTAFLSEEENGSKNAGRKEHIWVTGETKEVFHLQFYNRYKLLGYRFMGTIMILIRM
jgi:hypothetical protein